MIPFICHCSILTDFLPLSFHKTDAFEPGRHWLLPHSLRLFSTLDRDTWGHFQDYFSQGDNLLFALCMSAELLNFEDSWMKLDVANLHLQIDFVHMGVCTQISGDKEGNGVWQLMDSEMSLLCLSLSMGLCNLAPQFPFIKMKCLGDFWSYFSMFYGFIYMGERKW